MRFITTKEYQIGDTLEIYNQKFKVTMKEPYANTFFIYQLEQVQS